MKTRRVADLQVVWPLDAEYSLRPTQNIATLTTVFLSNPEFYVTQK
jgi:hypothetical protein